MYSVALVKTSYTVALIVYRYIRLPMTGFFIRFYRPLSIENTLNPRIPYPNTIVGFPV